MEVIRKQKSLLITHKGKELDFQIKTIYAPKRTTGNDLTRQDYEDEFFVEINQYWQSLGVRQQDRLFDLYNDVQELCLEPDEVFREHLPGIVNQIVDIHNIVDIMKMFPRNKVWIPEDAHKSFNDVCVNYTEEMTYLEEDYYNIILFSIWTRCLYPVYAALGVYTNVRNPTTEERQTVLYRTNYAYQLAMSTAIADHPAVAKLSGYLTAAIPLIKKATNANAPTLALVAVMDGFGSDSLEEYMMAFVTVHVLTILATDSKNRSMNIVKTIFIRVKTEVTTNLIRQFTDKNVREKSPVAAFTSSGEESKVGYLDSVRAKEVAPVKVPILSEVWFMDYRRAIKAINDRVTPTQAKVYVDSMHANPPKIIHPIHEWLVARMTNAEVHHQTLRDMESDSMLTAMALVQVSLIDKGYPELAVFLSATPIYEDVDTMSTFYPFDAITKELKEKIDIYYPMKFNRLINGKWVYVNDALKSFNMIIEDWVSPFYWELENVDPEVLTTLKTAPGRFIPAPQLRNSLADVSVRMANKK